MIAKAEKKIHLMMMISTSTYESIIIITKNLTHKKNGGKSNGSIPRKFFSYLS